MALQVTNINRVFTFKRDNKDVNLPDPNQSMTPQEVMKFYSTTYGELTNAIVVGPVVKEGKATYNFTTQAGKLG